MAFRKLSRTSSHRMLMLRNLVSSLLEHEQIKTTLPKAKEAARMAEKILSLGKRGDLPAQRKAASFLLNSDKTLSLLFGKYAERYKSRPGGYTRIHKFGHRKGDHAPHAILELCDNPRDIKFELVARSVGRETVQRWLKTGGNARADQPEASNSLMDKPWIRETTKVNYGQLMKFATDERKTAFESRAIHWANRMLAEAQASGGLRQPVVVDDSTQLVGPSSKHGGRRHLAGERLAGMHDQASSLGIASGTIGQSRAPQLVRMRLASQEAMDVRGRTEPRELQVEGQASASTTPTPLPSTRPADRPWRSPFWEGGWKNFSTSTGLEDYATESILCTLRAAPNQPPNVIVDATVGSGHVILEFPNPEVPLPGSIFGTQSALAVAIDRYLAGGFECVKQGYLCVADEAIDEETRKALHTDWREEDLRRNKEVRRQQPKENWGNRSGPDDRPKARGQRRSQPAGHEPSNAEKKILDQIQSMINNARSNLSQAMAVISFKPTRYTFRASLDNPQHLIPFPFLTTADIERRAGEAVSMWLDACEVECIERWEDLCARAALNDQSTKKKGRLWKVDLKESEVDVGVRIVIVPSTTHERRLDCSDTPPRYGGQTTRTPFPTTIRMLLTVAMSGPRQSFTSLSGRTALSLPAAHLLAYTLPTFSPFKQNNLLDVILIDPCSGTGAIPRQLVRMGQIQGGDHIVLCGDYIPGNASAAMQALADRSPVVEGFVWTAQGVAGGLREGVVDGIVSGEQSLN
ncbi:hypothetical protein FRB96_009663 [Tulasnella sp. 330]|nr:hypothetical protein FRB96_009663 [Tulasnella sp. 330]KAG8883296.1 hypothetical protein FRB97_006860 [Tulasnella sp. 331]